MACNTYVVLNVPTVFDIGSPHYFELMIFANTSIHVLSCVGFTACLHAALVHLQVYGRLLFLLINQINKVILCLHRVSLLVINKKKMVIMSDLTLKVYLLLLMFKGL